MKNIRQLRKILCGAVKPVERVGVTEWSEKYGRLPSDSAEPGRYRTDRTPYMREVMNSFTQPDIKRIVVKSAAQVGKAISIDEPIATPDGFKLMRDIEVGDKVFDERGEVCNVTGVSPIQYNRPCYEITFSDGATIVADGEHLWQIGDAILKTTKLKKDMKLPGVPVILIDKEFIRADATFAERSRLLQQFKELGYEPKCIVRRIVNVEKVESRPVKCIAVDSPSHLYLAGHELIPTHNSSVLLNIVGHTVHLNPANILIIQPTLSEAEDFSKARLAKFIRDCKVLTPLFYEKEKTRDANNTILSKFFKGGRIILVGANSSSGLASRPIKILLCDEVDRYPPSASGEGDPIALAEKRTSTYFDAKLALFSTPTVEGQSRIDLEYLLGTQEEWRHECPNCHEWHSLSVGDMICDFDEQKDLAGNKIVLVKSVAWRCPDCGLEFTEREVKNAAQRYFALNPTARANGIRSFWVNGFSSPWLSWKDILREWLEAKGNPQLETVVWNTRFGLSYRYEKKVADEMELLERLESYESEIPARVQLLTCGVDVQANRLHYLIMGHAPQELFGIKYGVIWGKPTDSRTWQQLDEVLKRDYQKENARISISRTFIDSGFATDAVYDFCRGRANIFPIKGIGTIGASLLHQFSPQKDKGVMLIVLGVNDGKAQVFSRLDKIHFGRDDVMERGFDATFFKELTSEHAVLKKSGGRLIEVFEKIGKHSRNEALDCMVYALAAAKSLIGDDEAGFYQQLLQPAKKTARKIRQAKVDIW